MKRFDAIVLSVLILVAACSCASPDRGGWRSLGVLSGASSRLEATYLDVIDALLEGMGHETLVERQEPQRAFERICHRASAPGNEARRRALSEAIMQRVGPETARPARVWLLRKIEPLGRDEVVTGLAALLGDDDPRIRELARRALQCNCSRRATRALQAALRATDDAGWQIALINALAARGDRSSAGVIVPFIYEGRHDVAIAAIAALPDVSGARSLSTLHALWRGAEPVLRNHAGAALLRAADSFLDEGARRRATAIYREIYRSSSETDMRTAALRGIAVAEGKAAMPTLLGVIHGDRDGDVQRAAARFAQDIPGTTVTLGLAAELDHATSEVRVLLLNVLGHRGDVAARDAVIRSLESPATEVRIAALRALEYLGDSSTAVLLAETAARTKGEAREAARESIARLRGKDIDDLLLARMTTAPPPVRIELIKALQARRVGRSVSKLFAAACDSDESVRVAAFGALAALVGEADLSKLVQALANAEGANTREAVEDAVVEAVRRTNAGGRSLAPVFAALPAAGSPARASLVRVLGRLEGEDALVVVRSACEDTDPEVLDAAVRALAQWSEPAVMDDLFAIAQGSENEIHKTLALRGFVRLSRLPSDRAALTTLELLVRAMTLAADDRDTKKLVLAACGDVMHPDALDYALSLVDAPELQAEAGAAVLEIARGISAEHYDESVAAIERVRAGGETPDELVSEAVEFIQKHRGYCVRWLFSGPYEAEGKQGQDLLDHTFPPEEMDAEGVTWKPLAVTDPRNPWAFDLTSVADATHCCGYVKTRVWSEQQQAARLHVGSDDGVSVWLNGENVHRHDVARGLDCGDDEVDIILAQGWNELLLKITQGGGNWGVCCGIRTSDGEPIDALRFEVE